MPRYRILVKYGHYYVLKRTWFWWKIYSEKLTHISFAENKIVQLLRDDEKLKNTKVVYQ